MPGTMRPLKAFLERKGELGDPIWETRAIARGDLRVIAT